MTSTRQFFGALFGRLEVYSHYRQGGDHGIVAMAERGTLVRFSWGYKGRYPNRIDIELIEGPLKGYVRFGWADNIRILSPLEALARQAE